MASAFGRLSCMSHFILCPLTKGRWSFGLFLPLNIFPSFFPIRTCLVSPIRVGKFNTRNGFNGIQFELICLELPVCFVTKVRGN
ncbi:MAG: hypothetical protein CFE21_04730 [Bacteroidetes bacterium B1(2017)]|nr:MAG: hypothetical protein CFE21_04730 [Bacteroidetes bacterium B1(2017)]